LRVIDIVARYPGSSHDSFIFQNSEIKQRFESGEFESGILLADSGYGLKTYVMTPLRNPVTSAQALYNESHIKTRNSVERQYGVMKRRFPCLSLGMRLNLETQLAVIVACAVLHNFCIMQKDNFNDFLIHSNIEPYSHLPIERVIQGNNVQNGRNAKAVQEKFINYFGSLSPVN
jgi:hypothetical protein